ncbi:hypothetical protein ACTFIR_003823 [Dictyostelium discoideum]
MLNKLLLLGNQIDIVNDPFITRILTGIHKLSPSFANYQEIWDVNQVLKHLSTIKVIPKYTYTALLNKKLVLCIMFGLARSSDLVKWCFVNHIIFILKGRRKSDSDDSVFIRNEGKPLDVKEINIIVLSTLTSSGVDISKYKFHIFLIDQFEEQTWYFHYNVYQKNLLNRF